MHFRLSHVLILLSFIVPNTFALKSTRGTPLGGLGTGYVGFDATKGNFYVSGKTPPAGADGFINAEKGADYNRKPSSSGFYLFADGQAVSKATTTDEDAKCPAYFANFGKTKGVTFKLSAFGPYCPGDDPENFKLASSPMALLEIMAINENSSAVDVAAAMEFANGGLLGGANSGTVQTGNNAISFSGTENAYLLVDCDGKTPTYSAGSIGTFTTAGTLSNSDGNLVAAKCNVAAGDSVRFKFVLAWWRKYETTTTSRYANWDGKENYWYHNNFDNSQKVAEFGKEKFDKVKKGITSFIDRTMASNLPDWYKDRLLNNTYPLIHNSQLTKDGRLAFWEGKYGIIGTIDQGEHAALFYTFNWPEIQWKELNYWKSTTRQGANLGQIHHDFNIGTGSFQFGPNPARFVCPFGDHDNDDYWWFPKSETWSDLNSMFIFKAYELMLSTGKKDSLQKFWPSIKQTANRIVTMSGSNSLPLTSHSTYDEKINGQFGFTPEYCGSVALATYLAIEEMATFLGDSETASKFRELFNKGKTDYKNKYAKATDYATGKDRSEGDVAGYSWANYLCLEPIMDSSFIAQSVKKLWSYYSTRSVGQDANRDKLGKWSFYTCDHYGGCEIATGNSERALEIHKWDWNYYYSASPGLVFWQTLRYEKSEKEDYASYMTAPTVWRSYFQIIGYLIDNANQRLWIRPRVPTSMNKKIQNAILLNPKALGTLNYDETVSDQRTQSMTVAFDSPVTIKEFMLKNNTGINNPGVLVVNNGTRISALTVKAEGSGFERNIRVTLSSPLEIGPEGVKIEVFAGEVGTQDLKPIFPEYQLAIGTQQLRTGSSIRFSIDKNGPVVIELLNLNGSKITTLLNQDLQAGDHSIIWNGNATTMNVVGSMTCILRLKSQRGSVAKAVTVLK